MPYLQGCACGTHKSYNLHTFWPVIPKGIRYIFRVVQKIAEIDSQRIS